jgi:hypothetical protein
LGTGVQVPTVPGRAQEKQGPSQLVAQQTPCAQKPLTHSALTEQAVSWKVPQAPFTHGVPGAQSAAVAQEEWQPSVCGSHA